MKALSLALKPYKCHNTTAANTVSGPSEHVPVSPDRRSCRRTWVPTKCSRWGRQQVPSKFCRFGTVILLWHFTRVLSRTAEVSRNLNSSFEMQLAFWWLTGKEMENSHVITQPHEIASGKQNPIWNQILKISTSATERNAWNTFQTRLPQIPVRVTAKWSDKLPLE